MRLAALRLRLQEPLDRDQSRLNRIGFGPDAQELCEFPRSSLSHSVTRAKSFAYASESSRTGSPVRSVSRAQSTNPPSASW